MEQGKLYADVKGEIQSDRIRKNESTEAAYSGGITHSSEETSVMEAEQRGYIIRLLN
jgi:hypothetical protein